MSTTPAAESTPPKRSPRKNGVARLGPASEKTVTHEPANEFSHAAWQDWDEWCQRLRKRSKKLPYLQLLPAAKKKKSPFASFLPQLSHWRGTRELLETIHAAARAKISAEDSSALRDQLSDWLAAAPNRGDHSALLLEAIAWTAISPSLLSSVERHQWLELMELVEHLAMHSAVSEVSQDPWRVNLTAELGWWLALLYPEIPQWHALVATSRETMSHTLCELTDGEGLFAVTHWPFIRPLLACWTRSGLVARALSEPFLHVEANAQWVWFVQQAILLTRGDGSQVFENKNANTFDRRAFLAALNLTDNRLNTAMAEQLLPGGKRLVKKATTKPKKNLPKRPSNVSEWSEAAILRTDWSHDCPLFCATFANHQLASDFSLGESIFWSGSTQPQISIDGLPLERGEIRVACLFHDKDVEYIELELEYGEQWRVQRQMLLARNDQFLLLGDAVIGPGKANIDFRSTLPLTEGTELRSPQETREIQLISPEGRPITLLPLALPEWRTEPANGELAVRDHGLVLSASMNGNALFSPLFIDFSRRRQGSPLTWRRLTVAENREVQPPWIATGYRVHIGKDQWLVYRSMTGRAGRTVLGQHLLHEFVVGRFLNNGAMDTLLQIEPADDE